MGKVLKPLLLVAAVAVNVVPGIGQAMSGLMVLATGSISAGLAVGGALVSAVTALGLSAGLSMVMRKPKISAAQLGRLNPSLVPSEPRKIVFGQTAMPTDIRYYEPSGADDEYVDYIIACAAHEVEAIDELWFEDRLCWSAAGGVQSYYSGYVTVSLPRLAGTAGNTVSINGGYKWGSARRLTGCAYLHLRLKRTGNSKKAESPVVQGLPSRVTIKGRGARLYDPRLDSTMGGNGPQRVDDQGSWGTAAGRDNLALQILWYLLGWRINGKLSVGCGMPANRVDMQSFITAANICDESIALASGGSQARYRGAGVFSEADPRLAVLESLLSACNGSLRDAGGRFSLSIMTNDLGSPVLDFNDDDILGPFSWKQTSGLQETLNVVRGRWTDPSNNSLFQMIDYPSVSLPSADGVERVLSLDLPLVQDSARAQRIAKQALQRQQYQGTFEAEFGVRALGVSIGDVVHLSLEALGWDKKLFRVLSQTVRQDGRVPMLLREEHHSIYAWDKEDTAGVTPTAPTVYDPLKSPFILGISDAEAAGKFVWIAYADSIDGAVNFTTAGPSGRAFIGIAHNKPVATESQNPADYSWSAYKGPANFGLVASGAAVVAADSLVGSGADGGWGSAGGYSSEGFARGAVASFTDNNVQRMKAFGLNADPTSGDGYASIDFCILIEGGSAHIRHSGVQVHDIGTVVDGDRFTVHHDGRVVRYLRNGQLIWSHASTLTALVYLDVAIRGTARLDTIAFAAAGAAGDAGASVFNLVQSTSNRLDLTEPGIIRKTGAEGWNNSFRSTAAYGNGVYVSFRVSDFSLDRVVVGFDSIAALHETDEAYMHLDYAVSLYTVTGQIYAYKNGVNTVIGSFATGDVISIAYDGRVGRIWRNATLLETFTGIAQDQTYYVKGGLYYTGSAVEDLSIAPGGKAGSEGTKGASAIGFVQDSNPGNGEFVSQTWYRPTSKEWYRWTGSTWSRILGDLSAKDLIADSAYLANGVIINAKIGNLQVDTAKIGNNAVTIPVSAYSPDPQSSSATGWRTLISAAIVSSGAPISIDVGFIGVFPGQPGSVVQVRILRGATWIMQFETAIGNLSRDIQFLIMDTPGAGNRTYSLQINSPVTMPLVTSHHILRLLEVKK